MRLNTRQAISQEPPITVLVSPKWSVYVASKQYKRKLYQPGGRGIINHSSTCSARYSSLVYAQRSSCRCSVKAPKMLLMRVIPASEHSDEPSWFLQIEIKHQTTRKAAKLTKFNYFPARARDGLRVDYWRIDAVSSSVFVVGSRTWRLVPDQS
jgi:hypothetical protein